MAAEPRLHQSEHGILPVNGIGSAWACALSWPNQTKQPLFTPRLLPQHGDQTALWFLFLLVSLFGPRGKLVRANVHTVNHGDTMLKLLHPRTACRKKTFFTN